MKQASYAAIVAIILGATPAIAEPSLGTQMMIAHCGQRGGHISGDQCILPYDQEQAAENKQSGGGGVLGGLVVLALICVLTECLDETPE